jgi:hypothetical protein
MTKFGVSYRLHSLRSTGHPDPSASYSVQDPAYTGYRSEVCFAEKGFGWWSIQSKTVA